MVEKFIHNSELSPQRIKRAREMREIIDLVLSWSLSTQEIGQSQVSTEDAIPVVKVAEVSEKQSFFYNLIADLFPEIDQKLEYLIQAIENHGMSRLMHAEILKHNPKSLTEVQKKDIHKDFINFIHLFNLVSSRSRDADDEVVKEKIAIFCIEYMDHHYDEVMVTLLHESITGIKMWIPFKSLEVLIRNNWGIVAETRQKSDSISGEVATSAS